MGKLASDQSWVSLEIDQNVPHLQEAAVSRKWLTSVTPVKDAHLNLIRRKRANAEREPFWETTGLSSSKVPRFQSHRKAQELFQTEGNQVQFVILSWGLLLGRTLLRHHWNLNGTQGWHGSNATSASRFCSCTVITQESAPIGKKTHWSLMGHQTGNLLSDGSEVLGATLVTFLQADHCCRVTLLFLNEWSGFECERLRNLGQHWWNPRMCLQNRYMCLQSSHTWQELHVRKNLKWLIHSVFILKSAYSPSKGQQT